MDELLIGAGVTPGEGCELAEFAADGEDGVGVGEEVVSACLTEDSGDTGRERVAIGDDAFAGDGGENGGGKVFGELGDFVPGGGPDGATTDE